jgi:hypothetical protein
VIDPGNAGSCRLCHEVRPRTPGAARWRPGLSGARFSWLPKGPGV